MSSPNKKNCKAWNVKAILTAALLSTTISVNAVVYQVEGLTANSNPPNLAVDAAVSGASKGSQNTFNAFGENQWVEYSVYVDQPGTFSVKVRSEMGNDHGTYQLYVDGHPIGESIDQYAKKSRFAEKTLGNVTFLSIGYKIFKFQVSGKNSNSKGLALSFDKIELKPISDGFTLLSPNNSYDERKSAILRWRAFPKAKKYEVYLSGKSLGRIDGDRTSYEANDLTAGTYDWWVVAIDRKGRETKSNVMSFAVGGAPDYEHREFKDDFESGSLEAYQTAGVEITKSSLSGKYSLEAQADSVPAYASLNDVTLEKIGEGQVSATVKLGSKESKAGVGFRADDGTFVYALLDAKTNTFRIERRIEGYSILDTRVTPAAYQIVGVKDWEYPTDFELRDWEETKEGDEYVWTLDQKKFKVNASKEYVVELVYSRRSMCLLASVSRKNGKQEESIVDISDLRIMNRPAVICSGGSAVFDDLEYEPVDRNQTKWDPDTLQVVMKPTKGTWDEGGAFNPAVIYRDGIWHMIYRGTFIPAPGDGPWGDASESEIGYAYSEDGINWTKHPANPVIGLSAEKDSIMDPDMLIGEDGYIYLEMRDRKPFNGEVMWRSKDFIHWEHAYDIARPDEERIPGKGWKFAAYLDTHTSPLYNGSNEKEVEIQFRGKYHRYIGFTERGRLALSNDLSANDWQYVTTGAAEFNSAPHTAYSKKECLGDALYDEEGNIRTIAQVTPGHKVGGHPECTLMEIALDGNEPWKVLHTPRLPFFPAWYGRALTGAVDEMTAWDGSTMPGNTVEKDGWLWHFAGANNTFTGIIKAYDKHVFECRNLTLSDFAPKSGKDVEVSVVVRNVGNRSGTSEVALIVDGVSVGTQEVFLARNEEKTIAFPLNKPAGIYTVGAGTASATMFVR